MVSSDPFPTFSFVLSLLFIYYSRAVNQLDNQHDNLPHGPPAALPTPPGSLHDNLHDNPQGATSYQHTLSIHPITTRLVVSWLATCYAIVIMIHPINIPFPFNIPHSKLLAMPLLSHPSLLIYPITTRLVVSHLTCYY